MEHKTLIEIAALVYNLVLVITATVVVAVYDWSLWTYVGFAFFMVSTTKD